MKNKYLKHVYREESPSEGGDNGGGKSEAPKTPSMEEFQALQASIAKLEENNKALLAEKRDAKTAAEKAALEAAKKAGDIEAIEKSWQEKYAKDLGDKDSLLRAMEGTISELTAGSSAMAIVSELSVPGFEEALAPHVKSRIKTEYKDGKPTIRVLDRDGKPSAMTLDDLKTELRGAKHLAALIKGSMANGDGGPAKGGNNSGTKTVTRAQFDAMSQSQRMEFSKSGGKVT